MTLTRRLGLVAAITCTSVALISTGPAFAKGGGGGGGGGGGTTTTLTVVDNCGGHFTMRESVPGQLTIGLTEFTGRNETWSLAGVEQDYDVVTGGRTRVPISMQTVFRSFGFEFFDRGFSKTATIVDTPNMTHGFSYVATRISPSPLTCIGQAYWTNHDGSTIPDPLNPTAKPDTAPALTGVNAAQAGTNSVSIGFDQEMLATAGGLPTNDKFAVTVDGVSRDVLETNVVNSDPLGSAAVSLVLGGDPLPAGANVTVQYQQPLATTTVTAPRELQDLDGLSTPSFGPLAVTVQ